jgi:hypothetical protein
LKLDLDAAGTRDSGFGTRTDKNPRIPKPGSRIPTAKETSWWTARATAGVVTSGFTKEEILRKPKQNPREEGGMFSRLEELLDALSPGSPRAESRG